MSSAIQPRLVHRGGLALRNAGATAASASSAIATKKPPAANTSLSLATGAVSAPPTSGEMTGTSSTWASGRGLTGLRGIGNR